MAFPINRPRRLRRTETIRRMVRETRLSPDDLILPFFVCPGRDVKKAVESMPGVAQLSVDNVVAEARETLCGRRARRSSCSGFPNTRTRGQRGVE